MYYAVKGNADFVEFLKNSRVLFLLAVGNTKTAEVPGITAAGENKDLIAYTPPADAELLYHGRCLSISGVPATPDGKPTPALISYAALNLTKVPLLVVDAGLMIKPKIPYVSLNAPVGENIAERRAMKVEDVENIIFNSRILAKQLSKICDVLMIGESIPAGTTTAAAVLKAMGFEPAVSSSMPENPIELKRKIVEVAVRRVKNTEPLEILSAVGDPVLAAVTGLACGFDKFVVLAGGTQMVAASKLIEAFGKRDFAIATTKYVAKDGNADLNIASCSVVASDPKLGLSKYDGLKAYERGFVKEGVGAGGLTLLCYARGFEILPEVERCYEKIILKR